MKIRPREGDDFRNRAISQKFQKRGKSHVESFKNRYEMRRFTGILRISERGTWGPPRSGFTKLREVEAMPRGSASLSVSRAVRVGCGLGSALVDFFYRPTRCDPA